jgi:hypothetical protein
MRILSVGVTSNNRAQLKNALCGLAGWLAGWLVGWLAWLVVWRALVYAWLVDWLANPLWLLAAGWLATRQLCMQAFHLFVPCPRDLVAY